MQAVAPPPSLMSSSSSSGGGEGLPSSLLQKKSLKDVFTSIREVILSQQDKNALSRHEPTSTEFFAVLITILSTNVETNHLIQLLTLLDGVIPTSSLVIVKEQFKITSNTLLKIVKLASASMSGDAEHNKEMNKIIRLSLVAIGTLLTKQELGDGFWGSLPALQALNSLLGYIDDELNNKTRRDVVDKLMSLLVLHSKNTSNSNNKFFRNYISDFCLGVINSCTRSNYKRTLYIVMFLESALPLISSAKQLVIISKALSLQVCNQPILNAALFRMLDSYYQSPRFNLSQEQTIGSIKLLLENNPLAKTKDMEATVFFCTTIASALSTSNRRSNILTIGILQSCLDTLLDCLDCEFMQIHVAISTSIRRIIAEFVDSEMISDSVSGATSKDVKLTSKAKCFIMIVSKVSTVVLDLRYKSSWEYTLNIAQTLFDVARNDNAVILLKPLITTIVNIFEKTIMVSAGTDATKESNLNNALYGLFNGILGHIFKSIGTKNFLSVIPFILPTSANYVGVDDQRDWVPALLRSNLKSVPGRLNDFIDLILGHAKRANDVLRFNMPSSGAAGSTSPNGIILKKAQIKILKTRVEQLWSLLPDFCDSNHGITDILTALPRISKVFEMTLKDSENYSDLRPYIISSLTLIAKSVREKYPSIDANSTASIPKEVELLKEQSQIFLPVLLTFIDNEVIDISDSNFQSIIACISTWASIANSSLIVMIAKRILQLLITNTITSNEAMVVDSNTDGSESVKISGYINVLQAIIPYLPESMLFILLKTIKPLLEVHVSLSLQKRSYAILDSLLKSHFGIIYSKFESDSSEDNALLAIVSHNITNCHISARNMRLRCLLTLLNLLIDNNYDIGIINNIYRKIFNDILICLKDNNKKTRENSNLILKIFIDNINFTEFVTSIYGIITTVVNSKANASKAANSAKSSALIAVCILLYEKRENRNVTNTIINAILPVIRQLLLLENSEVSKSCLSFLRVCSAVVPLSVLLNDGTAMTSSMRRYTSTVLIDSNINILEDIITNITVSIGQTLKTKFSSRVRAVMRKLHKRVGGINNGGAVPVGLNSMDSERGSENSLLRQYLPDSDVPLLEYIIKQQKRSDRKSKRPTNHGASGNRLDDLLGSDSEDDDDKNNNNHSSSSSAIDYRANKAERPKATRLIEAAGVTIGDLPQSLNHMINEKQYSKQGRKAATAAGEKDDEDDTYKVSITDAGHVVISEKNGANGNEKSNRKRCRDNGDEDDGDSEAAAAAAKDAADANAASLASQPKFINLSNSKEGSTSSKRARREPGEEYRSKKSGGDVWRKGMLEPHAFIPLDPRLFNIKKNFGEAVTHMSSVVKGKGGSKVARTSKSSNKPSVSKAVFNRAQLGSRKQREAARKNKKTSK